MSNRFVVVLGNHVLLVWMLVFVTSTVRADSSPRNEQSSTSIKTVILISIDGLGQSLLQSTRTPEIDRLVVERGARAAQAETVIPPRTIAAHVSMLTGLTPEKHGRIHNENDGKLERVGVPTIFDLLALRRHSSHAILGKEKLAFVFGPKAFASVTLRKWPILGDLPSRDPSFIAEGVIQSMKSKDLPSLIFAHFALPDTMGHWFQWGSWIQKAAVENVDSAVGRIARHAEANLPKGSYAIIVTADHGGHEGSHGQGDAQGKLVDFDSDVRIPWVIHGAGISKSVDKVRVIDTAPSIAKLLGIEVPTEWNWEGRSVIELLR